MKSLRRFLEEAISLSTGLPYLKKSQIKRILEINKEWLTENRQCKIKCEECFVALVCPYPKLLKSLNQ